MTPSPQPELYLLVWKPPTRSPKEAARRRSTSAMFAVKAPPAVSTGQAPGHTPAPSSSTIPSPGHTPSPSGASNRCLGAVYSITTFIRAMTSLLQIQQFARLRSTTCSLQGLSSTQRSARATPSRDRTLGVKEQKRNPKRLSVPRSRKSTGEDRIERNPTVSVLPPMVGGPSTRSCRHRRSQEEGQGYRRKEAAVAAFRFSNRRRWERLCRR